MKNATAFWGTNTCPGTNLTVSAGAATCNGDGNDVLVANGTNANELFRAWQHLANAGLIEGSYAGVSNDGSAYGYVSLAGYNIPASKLSNASWSLHPVGEIPLSDGVFFEGSYGNAFMVGNATTYVAFNPVFKPEEAWNIDSKLDDGRPALGLVTSMEMRGTTCSDLAGSSTSQAAAVYLLNNSAVTCSLVFKQR